MRAWINYGNIYGWWIFPVPLWLNVPWSNKGILGTNKQISLLSAFALYPSKSSMICGKTFKYFQQQKKTTTKTNISTSKQGLEIELLKFKSLKTRTKPVEMTLFNPSSSRWQGIWPQHFKQMDIIFTESTPTLPGSDNHRLHWDLSLWKLVQYGRATRPGKTPSLLTKKGIQTIITIIFTVIRLSRPKFQNL